MDTPLDELSIAFSNEDIDIPCGIFTIARINADSFDVENIHTAKEVNEVWLKSPSSEINLPTGSILNVYCEAVVDDISPKSHEEGYSLASQDEVWNQFKVAFSTSRCQRPSNSFSVLAVGGPASGKSHSLFGDLNSKQEALMGVVPRFIRQFFSDDEFVPLKPKLLQISMYLLVDEQVGLEIK
jgi:hypothetical protein